MGYLSDSLDFEKFFAKDLWSGIKKDPKRLVLGVDPASTWAWNKVLGRDDDPLVDQMGGPYDGRVISYGHNNGGVYDRAQAAGINTDSAAMNHDAAHLIAGSYAAMGGLGGAGGSGGGSGANPGLWDQGFAGTQGFGGAAYGSNPAAGISGIGGPVGGGTGASAAAGMGGMDYAKLGLGLAQSAQPQQQAQPQMAPPPQQKPSGGQQFAQSINGGLGRVSAGLFPVDPRVEAENPAYAQQMRNNAMLQLGLGMAAASGKPGATFAQSFGAGLGSASSNLEGAMQTAYQNARMARADRRADSREERDIANDQRQVENDQWTREYRQTESDRTQKNWQAEQDAMAQYRDEQAGLRRKEIAASIENARTRAGEAPNGYYWTGDPQKPLAYVKGGPADPAVSNSRSAGVPTEDERKSAGLAVRMENALNVLKDVGKGNPGALKPEMDAATFGSLPFVGDTLRNSFNSTDRQRVEAAQRDALDAALTLATGAAYTKQQFEDTAKSYFPQMGDDEKTVQEKQSRLDSVIQTARIRAGRAESTIDPLIRQPVGAAPAVGAVEDGYRFKGGNPSDKANWERVQ